MEQLYTGTITVKYNMQTFFYHHAYSVCFFPKCTQLFLHSLRQNICFIYLFFYILSLKNYVFDVNSGRILWLRDTSVKKEMLLWGQFCIEGHLLDTNSRLTQVHIRNESNTVLRQYLEWSYWYCIVYINI